MAAEHGVKVEGELGAKPTVSLPGGEPPAGLITEDLTVGQGAEAGPTARVDAHYLGVGWTSGRQFDASWDRGASITFPLSGVIRGWSEGIPGMRVGGRRLLIIPGELAYGRRPPPGAGIAPDETLVFVVDLVDVT